MSELETTEIKRGPGRPPLRPQVRVEASSIDRARQRAAEIRGNRSDEGDGSDPFATPSAPDGFEYQWKRKSVFGKEDTQYVIAQQKSGWEPVESARHPGMMPEGHAGPIERDGLVLCECPKEIVEDYRRRDQRAAGQQVAINEAKLAVTPEGSLPRDADARTRPTIRKEIRHVPVSDD